MRAESFDIALPAPGPRPPRPVSLSLAPNVLEASQDALRTESGGVREALVLWAGRPTIDGVYISHLIVPSVESDRLYLTVPQSERIQITDFVLKEKLLVFADLHTHPEKAFLSGADRVRPFSQREGFYALVIPYFATGPLCVGWTAYEFIGGDWPEVRPNDRFQPWAS